ncbi:hypothetical protein BJP34_32105 [Moorena producens PAL-8-15-08-1]|uniref:Uncharacterized protein n=1 Tax=Moorena producens PAL-8-15-08-1 TaxID=1458985 RepID=A0A1D8U0P6_9CYAN|nr:hypothetical protein BJP34_32105 [Moorena producens PAL-8-15-08-1]
MVVSRFECLFNYKKIGAKPWDKAKHSKLDFLFKCFAIIRIKTPLIIQSLIRVGKFMGKLSAISYQLSAYGLSTMGRLIEVLRFLLS